MEIVEYSLKIEEEVKAMQSEIKGNVPRVTGRKPGLKSTVWSRWKKQTFNQNRMKKQEFRKMRRGLGTSRTSLMFHHPNYRGARRRTTARN